jgi:hypothetical protein
MRNKRLVSISLVTIMALFALADVYQSHNSQAIRYIKGTLALAIAVAGFLMLPTIGMAIAGGYLNSKLSSFGSSSDMLGIISIFGDMILVPIAELSAIGAIEQFAKEALS